MPKNKAFDHSKYQNWIDPNDVVPYEKNAKIHTDKQIGNICTSIRRFGWQQDTVITKDNVLVIGHGRRLAALKLGCEMPYHRIDKDADELTDNDIRELRIADNQTNAETGFDMSLLESDLEGLEFEGFDFGFDGESGGDITESDIIEDDYEPVLPETPVSKYGDIWQLGNHRVMCGDSTIVDDVEKLMNGHLADLVVTDPPYNMAYEGAGRAKDKANKRIMNDNLPEKEFCGFLTTAISNYNLFMEDGASLYCFYKELGSGVFLEAIRSAGLNYKQVLTWVKNQIVLGGAKYQNMYEPCIFANKGDRISVWNGKRKQRSVIESIDFLDEDRLRQIIRELVEKDDCDVIRENKPLVNDLHPKMKPIKLLARFILNSSNEGDIVMDLFGGSGSTLIACEQSNRACYTMELDPKFCDVIVKRWESFTGEKGVLLNV